LNYRFLAAAGGLGDSPGGGLTGALPLPNDGAGDAVGVGNGELELFVVGVGVISTVLVGLGTVVGAIEGIGDGKSEDTGPGVLVVSGPGTEGDGSGEGVLAWPANKAVPIP